MTSLARRVASAIRDRSLLASGDRVAAAVSGGADSVALAHLLVELSTRADWRLAGLIHVHHGLRGADADADETFCRALAARLGLPIDVVHADVPARVRDTRQSLEAAARDVRYAAFREAMARLDATVVATGHTQDDQAETVLLRLLRGAGTRGLAGIRARRGLVVRPLLDCRRDELRAYLHSHGAGFREDASNDDRAIPRNRLRHELMPVVERLAPRGVAALARLAALAADDEAYFARTLAERAAGLVAFTPGGDAGRAAGVTLDAAGVAALPRPLARRLLRDLGEQVSGRPWSAAHVDALVALACAAAPSGHLDLPGATAARQGTSLALDRSNEEDADGIGADVARAPVDPIPLAVPGSVTVPGGGATLVATSAATVAAPFPSEPDVAVVQADALVLPLAVRTRRPGDRLRPLGAPGSRKLQDVFVDRKVPRAERDAVPIVVDANDRIVWVAGHVLAHRCRVTEPCKGVVTLELRR